MAWNHLGFQPMPYRDDPGRLNYPIIKFAHLIGVVLTLFLPIAAITAIQRAFKLFKRTKFTLLLISLILWVFTVSALILDPWDAFKWFLD